MSKENKAQKIWILTSEHNDYDQHGAYFICAFKNRPTLLQIAPILGEHGYINEKWDMAQAIVRCEHVCNGGGRIEYENQWFNLEEVELK